MIKIVDDEFKSIEEIYKLDLDEEGWYVTPNRYYIKLGRDCEVGDFCRFGNYCKLGDYCHLGDNCVLGDYCELGNNVSLGDNYELKDKTTINRSKAYIWPKNGGFIK